MIAMIIIEVTGIIAVDMVIVGMNKPDVGFIKARLGYNLCLIASYFAEIGLKYN